MDDFAIVQYVFDEEEVSFSVTAKHGNSKSKKEFFPIRSTVKDKICSEFSHSGKGNKEILRELHESSGGLMCDDPSNLPRSSNQIKDFRRDSVIKDQLFDIIYSAKEKFPGFVRMCSAIPEEMYLIGYDEQFSNIIRFCTDDYYASVLSVDPTFNHGPFSATPNTTHNLFFLLAKEQGHIQFVMARFFYTTRRHLLIVGWSLRFLPNTQKLRICFILALMARKHYLMPSMIFYPLL